jgi:flagellar basal body-associated protein FliL
MNKTNYLAFGAVALTVISVFLPWLEVSGAGVSSDEGSQPVIISGISIGYGIFGLLVVLTGGYLVYKQSKWTVITGVVNFINGYGYLLGWFGAGTHDSANYGDVTSRSSVDPKFGIYLFILTSLAFIIFTFKYYKKKKAQQVLSPEQKTNENQQAAFTLKNAAVSHQYESSKIQTMTPSTENPTGTVPEETPETPVPSAESGSEQPIAVPEVPEKVAETTPIPAQPAETPKEPEPAPIPKTAPVYQAPKAPEPQQQYVEPVKKKSSTAWIFLIILVIVLVGAGVFVMTNTSSQKNKDKTEQSVNDEKARLEVIINEVNQDVTDKKYDDALLKINSINWLYEPDANKGYVDQYNSQRENLRNTIEQLKSNQSLEDQKQPTDKAAESTDKTLQSGDSIH